MGVLMAVTKLEQWKNERNSKPKAFVIAQKTHVVEIECMHCHRHFFRWSSTAPAYWRCEDCSVNQ
ncbi:hypothetical protein QA646_12145 [Rhizobium sp. CB3090]|uniref:hypothetical protein n=1 Tax=Rhizobium sp. CB3090 TaxID=3039156 RepID=UPI0024B20A1C|nr:hypothetical protein [Rhizobium sp. CB3090]WFU08062.1 hypothetical protein QA646_12145 [Rhizobium sp. CB3090]